MQNCRFKDSETTSGFCSTAMSPNVGCVMFEKEKHTTWSSEGKQGRQEDLSSDANCLYSKAPLPELYFINFPLSE